MYLLFLYSMEPGTLPCDEPKFIVFYGVLMSLFSMFCFNCKTPNPKVDIKKNGTMATVTQICSNCGPTLKKLPMEQPAIHFRKVCCWECDVMFRYSDVWCGNKQGLFTVQASWSMFSYHQNILHTSERAINLFCYGLLGEVSKFLN